MQKVKLNNNYIKLLKKLVKEYNCQIDCIDCTFYKTSVSNFESFYTWISFRHLDIEIMQQIKSMFNQDVLLVFSSPYDRERVSINLESRKYVA